MTRAFRIGADAISLLLRVTPNARKDECRGRWTGAEGEERLAVRVAAPPDKGRANARVIKLLATALDLPKSAISLTAGDKDRLKTIAIRGDAKAIEAKLKTLLEAGAAGDEA